MHLYCPTEAAVFLVACFDANGVLRFPDNQGALPGLNLSAQALSPINPQLMAVARTHMSIDGIETKLNIIQEFRGECLLNNSVPASLYCGIVDRSQFIAPSDWLTMASILRSLLKTPNQRSYMKALQVFSGGFDQQVRAVVPDHLSHDPELN
jgi:hypothetical protein